MRSLVYNLQKMLILLYSPILFAFFSPLIASDDIEIKLKNGQPDSNVVWYNVEDFEVLGKGGKTLKIFMTVCLLKQIRLYMKAFGA